MPPIGDLLAQITGEPSPTQPTHSITLPPKRKADDQFRKPVDKMQRTGDTEANSSRPITQPNKPSAVDASMAKMKLSPNGRNPPAASTTASFKNGRPTPPPSTDAPKGPPKKGSYAEIMARGKAAQATLGQVGKIQHKRIEKMPSKREREEMKAQKAQKLQKNLSPNSKFSKMGQPLARKGQHGAKENGKSRAEPAPEKKVKKAATATTGYAGTARPKPGASNGPSRSYASTSASRYDRGSDRNRYREERYGSSASSRRYTYASEDEEDEEEEQDYESDVSSDMEAAVFEVDDEEEEAARIARREDAEALAEENRLKREKEEKRRRLAAMAKSRR